MGGQKIGNTIHYNADNTTPPLIDRELDLGLKRSVDLSYILSTENDGPKGEPIRKLI